MSEKPTVKSPLGLRLMIWAGSILLSILLIWLIGFVLHDIGDFRSVELKEVEKGFISEDQRGQQSELRRQLTGVDRQIAANSNRQSLLKDRVATSRQTMTQMVELQKMNLEREVVNEQQEAAVVEAQKQFLDNQSEYQEVRDKAWTLKEEQRTLKEQIADLDGALSAQRAKAREEYLRQLKIQKLRAAALKLLVLLPVMALAVWLFLKKRSGLTAPLVYAVDFAVLYRVILIIHEYFPSEYYKYIFLLATIAIVIKVLLVLIKSAARPARDVLLKRYREAYRKGQCPVCAYPIVRGPLAEALRAAQNLVGRKALVALPSEASEAGPYACPSCGERLFEQCDTCRETRHSLLPVCQHCGDGPEV